MEAEQSTPLSAEHAVSEENIPKTKTADINAADDDDDILECTVVKRAVPPTPATRPRVSFVAGLAHQHRRACFVRYTKSLRRDPSSGAEEVGSSRNARPQHRRQYNRAGRKRCPGYNDWLRQGTGDFDFRCSNNYADNDSNSDEEWVGDNRRLWPVDSVVNYVIVEPLVDEKLYPISKAAQRPILSQVETNVLNGGRLYFLTKFLGYTSAMNRWVPAALILENGDNASKIKPDVKARLDRELERRRKANIAKAESASATTSKTPGRKPQLPSSSVPKIYIPPFDWSELANMLHDTDFWQGDPNNVIKYEDWRQWHSSFELHEEKLRIARGRKKYEAADPSCTASSRSRKRQRNISVAATSSRRLSHGNKSPTTPDGSPPPPLNELNRRNPRRSNVAHRRLSS